jgi:DMSO/TMAO reductase YedYZ heme-binding membrane subunit
LEGGLEKRKKMNNKFRYTLALFALSLIIIHLITLDYSDLSWSNNSAPYNGIISMVLLTFAMIYEIRRVNKQELPPKK